MTAQHAPQSVPVRIYQTDHDIVLAAPLPGMGPQNIRVSIAGQQVTIWGDERGIRQDDQDLLVEEWAIGPYFREITLPLPVSGRLANASYGNGVLVLAMPKRKPEDQVEKIEFQLEVVEATRGRRIGHVGHNTSGANLSRPSRKPKSTPRRSDEGKGSTTRVKRRR